MMEVTADYNDNRQKIIDRMNAGRSKSGKPVLTPRQEHLVREFCDDEGIITEGELLLTLLQSNSA